MGHWITECVGSDGLVLADMGWTKAHHYAPHPGEAHTPVGPSNVHTRYTIWQAGTSWGLHRRASNLKNGSY